MAATTPVKMGSTVNDYRDASEHSLSETTKGTTSPRGNCENSGIGEILNSPVVGGVYRDGGVDDDDKS